MRSTNCRMQVEIYNNKLQLHKQYNLCSQYEQLCLVCAIRLHYSFSIRSPLLTLTRTRPFLSNHTTGQHCEGGWRVFLYHSTPITQRQTQGLHTALKLVHSLPPAWASDLFPYAYNTMMNDDRRYTFTTFGGTQVYKQRCLVVIAQRREFERMN